MGDYLPDIPEGQVGSRKILPNGLVASRPIAPGLNGLVGTRRIDGNQWPFKYNDLGQLSGYTPGLIGSTGPIGYDPTPIPNSTTKPSTPLADLADARGLGSLAAPSRSALEDFLERLTPMGSSGGSDVVIPGALGGNSMPGYEVNAYDEAGVGYNSGIFKNADTGVDSANAEIEAMLQMLIDLGLIDPLPSAGSGGGGGGGSSAPVGPTVDSIQSAINMINQLPTYTDPYTYRDFSPLLDAVGGGYTQTVGGINDAYDTLRGALSADKANPFNKTVLPEMMLAPELAGFADANNFGDEYRSSVADANVALGRDAGIWNQLNSVLAGVSDKSRAANFGIADAMRAADLGQAAANQMAMTTAIRQMEQDNIAEVDRLNAERAAAELQARNDQIAMLIAEAAANGLALDPAMLAGVFADAA
ncbi:MAG: hypothetical protein ACO3O3_03095 [Ilumatobacteraceae bacterium]